MGNIRTTMRNIRKSGVAGYIEELRSENQRLRDALAAMEKDRDDWRDAAGLHATEEDRVEVDDEDLYGEYIYSEDYDQ